MLLSPQGHPGPWIGMPILSFSLLRVSGEFELPALPIHSVACLCFPRARQRPLFSYKEVLMRKLPSPTPLTFADTHSVLLDKGIIFHAIT